MNAHIDEPYEPYDEDCGDYVTCWQCGGEGYSHHDCGEDTCCCLHPHDNVRCDICEGKGGWPRPTTIDAEGKWQATAPETEVKP
jgi:hypothetical protein